VIRVRLAVLSDPDSGADPAADPDPAVWRFRHGEVVVWAGLLCGIGSVKTTAVLLHGEEG